MHPNAQKTAEAAMCANEQKKFWEFRKELFGDSWGKFSPDELKAAAKKTGLHESDFNACLDGSKMRSVVDEDMKIAQGFGVTGTPTFFINGSSYVGAQPVEEFQKIIDEKSRKK